MRYYKQVKITSFRELSEYFEVVHLAPFTFAVYFDSINMFRVFSNSEEELNKIIKNVESHEVPKCVMHVCCVRNRDAERGTERQKLKRLNKLREKFKISGIKFNEGMTKSRCKKPHYYVNIRSNSNGKSFRLNVRNEIKKKEKKGDFSSYGLSLNGSTVPVF